MSFAFDFDSHFRGHSRRRFYKEYGVVKRVNGPIVEGTLPGASIGSACLIETIDGRKLEAEVVGFRDRVALLMPLSSLEGVSMHSRIEHKAGEAQVIVGDWMIGSLLDGMGRPMGAPSSVKLTGTPRPIRAAVLNPVDRAVINQRIFTGVRAIDYTCALGKGQRIGIMAGSGVGKSVTMGMIAQNSKADLNVIALIGERGREVTEFVERDLGPEGLKKSIVIAVSSDESPVLRTRGALVATAIAEHFRDRGLDVLLMMDSVTRFAMAQREIGLAAGEPPTAKGYTPSVFAQLPKLLERAGSKKNSGSITGIYTVLVEGEDFEDPIADSVRSIVDGHVVLTRKLAQQNHYPPVDVLQSLSRLSHVVATTEEKAASSAIRSLLAAYREAEDLINIGAYRRGTNEAWDRAVAWRPKIVEFLKQGINEKIDKTKIEQFFSELLNG
ncbi:MAG TPA: FliI/YscN family ATPase [Bdellovibrionota bacterium]|jgi:flagellum-specific ATP synthase|nr:FliI/YscN family ATPase [Bdellovibrionota bacterium]